MEQDPTTTGMSSAAPANRPRDHKADWNAFAASDIPTKGSKIQSVETFLALHPPKHASEPFKRRLLDLGCGNGALSYELAVRGYDVLGVDINESAIEQAIRQYERNCGDRQLFFLLADSAASGGLVVPHRFHMVVCQLVISVVGRLQERQQLLANAWKALLPGGYLYISASGISDTINQAICPGWATNRRGVYLLLSRFQGNYSLRDTPFLGTGTPIASGGSRV